MPNKRKMYGQSTDLTLSWLTKEHGVAWAKWQKYASEWLAIQESGIGHRLGGLKHFFSTYLVKHAPYACDVNLLFQGFNGHHVSTEEFVEVLEAQGAKEGNHRYVSTVVSLIDFVISRDFFRENDLGFKQPTVKNPFKRVKRRTSQCETVRTPLPYRYVQKLRSILCPYGVSDLSFSNKNIWLGHHFKDWKWAIENLGGDNGAGWLEVEPETIDHDDPDCVWRERRVRRKNRLTSVFEIWSPVCAMFFFTKLHLPLRSYQVRFLDSGEADTWQYQDEKWEKNTNKFSLGSEKRPFSRGVFRRIFDSYSNSFSTGLYVSTNKTIDFNKYELDHGYVIPWQHAELLYWFQKLRNWQAKYNPITGPLSATFLGYKHISHVKTERQKKAMGSFCFLFRDAAASKGSTPFPRTV